MASQAFTILLVEDQLRHQRIYAEAIKETLGATTVFASDGDRAWQLLTADQVPDLVLLDLEIPGIRGEDLMRRIKGDHRLTLVPIMILTGLSSQDKQMELLELGADDFIEKGGPPSVLIARIRAQMRHKLAVDRLERMALDRDLFAAGVLHNIGSSKGTILNLCRQAKIAVATDPDAHKPEILTTLDKLAAHAGKLGAYANDVIQSVRETQREPKIVPHTIAELLDWVIEVLAEPIAGEQRATLRWEPHGDIKPVLADRSFLRLALLNVVQRAVRVAGRQPLVIEVSQSARTDPEGRTFLSTQLRDQTPPLSSRELSMLFLPQVGDNDDAGFHIGLALVAKVMLRMGGQVWAAGVADGTVVHLELPAAPLAQA